MFDQNILKYNSYTGLCCTSGRSVYLIPALGKLKLNIKTEAFITIFFLDIAPWETTEHFPESEDSTQINSSLAP